MNWFRQRRCLARLRSALLSRPHTILLFHSVGRPSVADFLPAGLDCDPAFFEKILQLLRAEATVVPLPAVLRKPGAVALTFDDGFRDNFTVVLPLLRRYELPATVFVAADAVGATGLLPIHRYYFAKQRGGEFAEAVDSPVRRAAVENFLRHEAVPELGGELYLGVDELRALARAGIEIGAHTCSHPWLAALPPDEQRREIVQGKRRLEELAGTSVTSFAYPYGFRQSFDATTQAIVAEQFRLACVSEEFTDTEALTRVNVANWG